MKHILSIIIIALLGVSVGFAQDDDLEVIEFDVDGSDFIEIELEITDDTASVLFHIVGEDPDALIGLFEIYDEFDEPVYILDDMDSTIAFGFDPYTEDAAAGELAVYLPSAPQYTLQPGTYYFGFATDDGTAIASASAIIRYGDVDSTTQALDINALVLSYDSGLDDASVQADFVASLRTSIDDLLNPHNMELGVINFIIPDDDTLETYSFPAIDEENTSVLNDICALMSAQTSEDRALNLVIVDGFDEPEDAGTAGIAMSASNAGVVLQESRYSCVVVSWEAYEGDFPSQAGNIIHEASHFMSLPHTTEEDGVTFDIFEDTAECDYDTFDTDGDDIVDDFECGVEGGAKNYMFWNGDPEAGLLPYVMSDDQAFVLRRHPLFYSVDN